MSVKAIYDSAPLGALIRFSNDKPKPPARFTRKIAAWERVNGVGRLVRKSPPLVRGAYTGLAAITLHEGDFASNGVVVLVVHRTHDLDSDLRFEVISAPPPGSCRIVQPFGETVELLHLADDRTAAETWLQAHRYSHARIEMVADTNQKQAASATEAPASATTTREAV
jgi:hypothetical protein